MNLFTVRVKGNVVQGLEKVELNTLVRKFKSTRVPLNELDVDDVTFASLGKDTFQIQRIQ